MIVDHVKVDSVILKNPIIDIDREDPKICFYPNPAHDFICFDTPDKFSLNIFNIKGILILSREDITDGKLSVSDLAPGIYTLQYRQNGIYRYSKMIKY
jgi:hypothetical protein